MINKKSIPLEQFTVQIANPANTLNAACMIAHEDGRFNMNGKLAGLLGRKKLAVGFTEDAKHLCLQEDDSNISAIFFPKNGSKKLEDVSVHLKRRGIAFPAKYEVWFNEAESFWQGDYIENPIVSPQGKRQLSKKK